MTAEDRIREHLSFLYGPATASETFRALQGRLQEFRQRNPQLARNARSAEERLTERDAFLITYGDQFQAPGSPPLQTLAGFAEQHLAGCIGGIHLLPHFPWSSDDGFSVIDYRQVDPKLGDWTDVARLGGTFRLMLDGVINHVSRQGAWFQAFLRVETALGVRHVWTTFSDDQMDLNFRSPQVLLEMIDVLLFYAEQGAEVIRLDAIAYLWKEIGTPCVHLPQTHRVVKLFRAVFDAVAPGVLLITETNVPHLDNISYFGDGTDEAQMVYNFALPPLILHTFGAGHAGALSRWAATLATPSPATTFFNFIASHDGIGVMPARGLLDEAELKAIVDRTLAHGGRVSYKHNPDGSQSPYELNITLFDALNDPARPDPELDLRRFLASQFIMLSLAGVPGIYIHSLFGSRNWHDGLARTGRARTINRRKFDRTSLELELADPDSPTSRVFAAYRALLEVRRAHRAFHPNSGQRVLAVGASVFALVRQALDDSQTILCLANVTGQPLQASVELSAVGLRAGGWRDLLTSRHYSAFAGRLEIALDAFECFWLMATKT
jgi:glycosidase